MPKIEDLQRYTNKHGRTTHYSPPRPRRSYPVNQRPMRVPTVKKEVK